MKPDAKDAEDQIMPFDPQRHARTLYWLGWGVSQIADETGIARSTVQSWKDRGGWGETPPLDQAQACLVTRFNMLVLKDKKTGHDDKEIDLLGRQMERLARVRRYQEPGGHEGDLNENVAARNAGPKKKARKNLIDREMLAKLKDAFVTRLYPHQRDWMNSTSLKTRMLLKARQIGATDYFSGERLIRALETGNNQIFISASRAQANVFRAYIFDLVFRVTGVELKGDPIVIDRGQDEDGTPLEPVTLYFLGTNYRTAQSYHGDVIIDEYAWIYGFDQIYTVASGMATQKRYTVTVFSTPSTIAHESYAMWSGEWWNRDRAKADRVKIDISHEALKDGVLGADDIFRQIITLQDAIDCGFDLSDIDQLRRSRSVEVFANLFDCQFVDDSQSSFPLSLVQPCMIDSWEVWRDYHPLALKPYAGEVWIGYDPNDNPGSGDPAGLVVLAAPKDRKDKFRVLERIKLLGLDFEQQADEIKKLTKKYRVTEIAIDTKGVGSAVYQLVLKFHPTARRIDYSPVVKGLMVQKAQNVFRNRRIELDHAHRDIAAALMSIHPEVTGGGKFITYTSRRSAELGHGDVGWALLNALYCEPLDAGEAGQRSSVEIFS